MSSNMDNFCFSDEVFDTLCFVDMSAEQVVWLETIECSSNACASNAWGDLVNDGSVWMDMGNHDFFLLFFNLVESLFEDFISLLFSPRVEADVCSSKAEKS